MSTATYQAHTMNEGAPSMVTPNTRLEDTRADLQEIINDLLVLKLMARDGIMTHKSQHDLVKHLNPKELAAVARGVALAEKRAVPCYEQPAPTKTETNFNR